jgi:ferric-dicitrate binding protein FerR (iron transport regulator)
MRNTNKIHDSEKERRIDYLIHVLFSDEQLSEDALDAICYWLSDERDAERKKEALRRYFSSRPRSGQRSEHADALWPAIATELGLNPDLDYYRRLRAERHAAAKQTRRASYRPLWRVAAVLVPLLLFAGGYFLRDRMSGDAGVGEREQAAMPLVSQTLPQTLPYTAVDSVRTESDSLRRLILPDGTEITLNRNSTLSYNTDRECELVGEAYFKVAKDPEHPFLIHSGSLTVTVLGTEFNFRSRPEDTHSTLSLYSGSVQLDHAGGAHHRLDVAGHEIMFDYVTARADIRDFDTTREPEWLVAERGSRLFTLGEIFDQIESAYGLTILNRRVVDLNQQYNFRLDPSNSVRAAMSSLAFAGGKFDYTIQGKTILLEPKP